MNLGQIQLLHLYRKGESNLQVKVNTEMNKISELNLHPTNID